MNELAPVVHVVDDDDAVRTAISRLLSAAGYDVRGYGSAGAMLLAPPPVEPGCIILDYRLPGPNGLQLQEALGRREDHLPVIFLTGHGDIPTTVQAMKAGAVDFLTKPVQRDALLGAVATAVQRDAARRRSRVNRAELRARYQSSDGPRTRRLRAHRRWTAQQADRRRARDSGAHDQGASCARHGKDAGRVGRRTGPSGGATAAGPVAASGVYQRTMAH